MTICDELSLSLSQVKFEILELFEYFKAETISKRTIHSQFLQHIFFRAKIKIFTWQVIVQT